MFVLILFVIFKQTDARPMISQIAVLLKVTVPRIMMFARILFVIFKQTDARPMISQIAVKEITTALSIPIHALILFATARLTDAKYPKLKTVVIAWTIVPMTQIHVQMLYVELIVVNLILSATAAKLQLTAGMTIMIVQLPLALITNVSMKKFLQSAANVTMTAKKIQVLVLIQNAFL